MFFIMMQSDQGKAPTSDQQFEAPAKDVINVEDIFYSTILMETIRKLLKILNMELIYLLKVQP